MSQQDEQAPRVVIRDERRIDPTSGAVREPAGDPPTARVPTQGEQMSENETAAAAAEQDAAAGDAGTSEAARQLAERTEDLQRVTAEYANYRRRVERDRMVVVDQSAERFAAQLFPVVDDIERARDHGDLTGAFKVVADRVLGLLDGLGVEAFGTAGDPFDPSLHEAVLHDTSPEVTQPTASTVLRQGYRRGDRVLRTAMVGVTDPEAPAPAQPAEAAPDAAVEASAEPADGPAAG